MADEVEFVGQVARHSLAPPAPGHARSAVTPVRHAVGAVLAHPGQVQGR
jgi:hypothetical protein